MKILNKLEQKKNDVLKREEIKIIVEAEKSPSLNEAGEIIAKEFNSEKDRVAVKLVKGKFGRNTFLISAFVYDSKEDGEKIEPKSKKKQEEQPAGQAPVEDK